MKTRFEMIKDRDTGEWKVGELQPSGLYKVVSRHKAHDDARAWMKSHRANK